MRRLGPLLLVALGCTTPHQSKESVLNLVEQADQAAFDANWAVARRSLEQASLIDPEDPIVIVRLARIELEAYGDVDRAETLYLSLPRPLAARRLFGLGLCALWRGDEERALRLLEDSAKEKPIAACLRELAVRRLARGEDAKEVLDLLQETSGATLRTRLLLAAAGRLPAPEKLPPEWTYALERARLRPLPEAAREVEIYVEKACATPEAGERMRRVLSGDFALKRNLRPTSEVK